MCLRYWVVGPMNRVGGRRSVAWVLGLLMFSALPAPAQENPELPDSLDAAVAAVVARLNPAQRSIVRGTARDSLFMLAPEWGEDIHQILGLDGRNPELVREVCGECSRDEATLRIMEAAWETLRP